MILINEMTIFFLIRYLFVLMRRRFLFIGCRYLLQRWRFLRWLIWFHQWFQTIIHKVAFFRDRGDDCILIECRYIWKTWRILMNLIIEDITIFVDKAIYDADFYHQWHYIDKMTIFMTMFITNDTIFTKVTIFMPIIILAIFITNDNILLRWRFLWTMPRFSIVKHHLGFLTAHSKMWYLYFEKTCWP